jgi:hypothetical protein
LLADGQRIGVRHFEHRGDAPHHGAARAGFEVFLVGLARLAKWTWVSITPGRMCRPLQSITSAAEAWPERADRGDAAVADGNIAHALAVLIDHGAGF